MRVDKLNAEQMETAKAELREWMPKGTTVYTILRSRSRSGMQRLISLVVFENGRNSAAKREITPIFPEYKVAQVLGYTLGEHEGIKINGCGMDMGFHLVYTLAQVIYGDGYALNHRWL